MVGGIVNSQVYRIKKLFYAVLGKREKLLKLNVEYHRSKGVKIGENVRSFSPLVTAEPYFLEIGNDVSIASNVKLITHDNSVGIAIPEATDAFGKIKIGNQSFIGEGAIIMPGVHLGDRVIVGAGSVVTKSFKDGNVVIAGNPARKICTFDEYIEKVKPYAFSVAGLSYEEKKNMLLGLHESKLLNK